MTANLLREPLLAFALPAHNSILHPRASQIGAFSQKRSRPSNTSMSLPSDATRLSRRAVLVSAALSASLALGPLPRATAYSSPDKPGRKTEQKLPDRLYEEEVKRVVTTSSGLQYFDLSKGSGTEAKPGDVAFVRFTSRLRGLNGIKIQSTYDDPNSPPVILKIGASDVVPGVSESLTDMKPAVTEFFARRRLLSVLETQRDATIVFDFELIKVK